MIHLTNFTICGNCSNCGQCCSEFLHLDKEELSALPNGVYFEELYTSKEFEQVYGKIKLIYSVVNRLVIIEDIEPSQFLLDGYIYELDTYKGMPYRNERDKFKIDLMIRRKNEVKAKSRI